VIIVNEDLLSYFRKQHFCELCGRRIAYGEPAHPHHVECRGMGGGTRLDVALNLLSACWQCHDKAHNGDAAKLRQEGIEIIAYREGLEVDQVQQAIWTLTRRDKYARCGR
jgi:hypothetical protein